MPSDVAHAELQPEAAPARPDRKDIVAFVSDAETETVLRDGLSDAAPRGVEFHRTNIRGAIDILRQTCDAARAGGRRCWRRPSAECA